MNGLSTFFGSVADELFIILFEQNEWIFLIRRHGEGIRTYFKSADPESGFFIHESVLSADSDPFSSSISLPEEESICEKQKWSQTSGSCIGTEWGSRRKWPLPALVRLLRCRMRLRRRIINRCRMVCLIIRFVEHPQDITDGKTSGLVWSYFLLQLRGLVIWWKCT